jgi:amidohydrolase
MSSYPALAAAILALAPLAIADPSASHEAASRKIDADYPKLDALYKDLHAHPELSLQEEKTSARVAAELRDAGCEVTEHFGGYGVVGVLKNGPGPTVLLRADMDALPVAEETGLPYASSVHAKDPAGKDVPVMHACGHDIHMTSLIGAARTLAALREQWSGTIIFIGQPAEELGPGARMMLKAGLFEKFPRPDFALGIHDIATLPAGTVAALEGNVMANVDFLDVTVRGVGGHGAYPHATKDPVVLASRIVVALQTIVSRETRPTDPAVVTVGSIHGGTKHNIIPDSVKLQLTLRSYTDQVREHTIEAVKRICRGEAIAAGIPDDLMPIVEVDPEMTPAMYNDPTLTRRIRADFVDWFGAERVKPIEPEMGGDDFSEFGRTAVHVPICYFRVGAVDPAKYAESQRTGAPLPSLHSSKFAPLPEPTIKAGVMAFTAGALDLLAKK